MPGIAGVYDPEGNIDASAMLTAMADCMRFDSGYVEERHFDGDANAAIGRTTLSFRRGAPQPFGSAETGAWAVMEGEVYSSGGRPIEGGEDLREVVRAVGSGSQALSAINGSFVAAIWDARSEELTLVNDRFGVRPVYYAVIHGRLLFSSNLAALLADPAVSPSPSKAGIAQFLTYGQYLGNDTSVEGIQVLPAGSIARFKAHQRTVEIETYWRFSPPESLTNLDDDEWLDVVRDRFDQAVRRQVTKPGQLGIALSGGLDARSILAFVEQEETPTTTICYSIRGSLDHRCSEQMSRLVGAPYHHYELGADFLSNYRAHLERMVLLTDGQYLSQCIVMPTLPMYQEHGIDVLLRGHAGELMHMHKAYAYSMDQAGLNASSHEEIGRWLETHLQAYMLDCVDGPLLQPEYQAALETAPRAALREAAEACTMLEPPVQSVWQVFLAQRMRRETALSMAKFMSKVDIRLPYLDNDLIDALLAAPPRLKTQDTMQEHLLRTRRPEFLGVVNANTGARIGAPKVVQRVSDFKRRVFGKLGVPGYQPYERLGLWLKRELAGMVRDILLSDQCKDRGVFRPDALGRVVDDHLSGRVNATYLIVAMMVIELGQRHLYREPGFEAHTV